MGSEIRYKKSKGLVPTDEFAKVKRIKQIVQDKTPQKRKGGAETEHREQNIVHSDKNSIATGDTELSTEKKIKRRNHRALENDQPTGAPRQVKATTKIDAHGNEQESKSLTAGPTARKSLTDLKCTKATKDTTTKCSSLKKAQSIERTPVIDDENQFAGESDGEEVDDQMDALLKVFESNDEVEKDLEDKGYEAGRKMLNIDKKVKQQAIAVEKSLTTDQPGVIYIGRIPHGFYEQEMRQYFSQFGDISKLRLSRNRKTGNSRHYAFIEFKSAAVAEIVSKTMDNYLLFGHILKCKMVAPEQVHENLWAGANKRFKKVPWNKMEGRKLTQGMTEAYWARRVEREETRRTNKQAAMKMIDYTFETPDLKSAKEAIEAKRLSVTKTEESQAIDVVNVLENAVKPRGGAEVHKRGRIRRQAALAASDTANSKNINSGDKGLSSLVEISSVPVDGPD